MKGEKKLNGRGELLEETVYGMQEVLTGAMLGVPGLGFVHMDL